MFAKGIYAIPRRLDEPANLKSRRECSDFSKTPRNSLDRAYAEKSKDGRSGLFKLVLPSGEDEHFLFLPRIYLLGSIQCDFRDSNRVLAEQIYNLATPEVQIVVGSPGSPTLGCDSNGRQLMQFREAEPSYQKDLVACLQFGFDSKQDVLDCIRIHHLRPRQVTPVLEVITNRRDRRPRCHSVIIPLKRRRMCESRYNH